MGTTVKAFQGRIGKRAVAEEMVIIELGRIKFPPQDAALLKSIKDSGTSEHDTYARLVRLFVVMGLELHRNGVYTLQQLQSILSRVPAHEVQILKEEIIAQVLAELRKPTKKPRKK